MVRQMARIRNLQKHVIFMQLLNKLYFGVLFGVLVVNVIFMHLLNELYFGVLFGVSVMIVFFALIVRVKDAEDHRPSKIKVWWCKLRKHRHHHLLVIESYTRQSKVRCVGCDTIFLKDGKDNPRARIIPVE